jgi:hypothetical protein
MNIQQYLSGSSNSRSIDLVICLNTSISLLTRKKAKRNSHDNVHGESRRFYNRHYMLITGIRSREPGMKAYHHFKKIGGQLPNWSPPEYASGLINPMQNTTELFYALSFF